MANPTVVATQGDSTAAGKAARKRLTRTDAGTWKPGAGRADPVAILERQALTRLPFLVPIRYARMMQSPFAFLRGAPAIMAADLAQGENTGLRVQLCGDAHIANFGLYASPERNLVFDVNDFDETLPGPFEWDVKRLCASAAVAARDGGCTDEQAVGAVRAAATAYRETMHRLAELDSLTVWYQSAAAEDYMRLIEKPKQRRKVEKTANSARRRTSLQALDKLTEPDAHGIPRIKNQPPLLVPIETMDRRLLEATFADYRESLPDERRTLIDRYEIVDFALKVVGVGSVGTRCFVLLLQDRETASPLFLQVKQAECSVLADHLAPSDYRHQGQRVVVGQRLMQSASDIFLGWSTGPADNWFYIRQLRDMKGSADIASMSAAELAVYAALCGTVLARAHARSGDRVAIAGYLGGSDVFDTAMADFALSYADQTLTDQQALREAIDSGRVECAAEPY
ncbi:uncharacterized protein (DUF2252 family) [Nocardia transvalensis]|uniref:Uncharacterized protein (DUF2252 family) n=1 Tax=Nocardia transvalensis TaxID=37333 RepID=A0A7W9PHU4_9NOCA|nr:DUF2252 domain-containing protein [Nocardia transvalensis]MBB5916356.1 uncharacterized protein (DUF2252 family) [Nocardia transvalensis]